jgi:murein L,D-transpeptidase YcbB/YkuD
MVVEGQAGNSGRDIAGGLVPAVVLVLGLAGCVTASPTQQASVTGAPQEPPPTAYLQMLREHGINVAIPARGKFVLVNIPSHELIAIEDGEPVLRSRVVVGKPALRTPELLSPMFAVRFNPAWVPTPAMIRNEGAVPMPPGPYNPLGRLVFEMDNDQFIFLHDTNQKGLFRQARRALSHGCVRVEQARPLAAWALDVSEREIDSMIASRRTYSVPLPTEIPVFLAYYTRFPDREGQFVSHADIYANWEAEERAYLARANARRRALARPRPPVPPPSTNDAF